MEDINNQGISVNLSKQDLKNLIGWATFNAIIDIIVGSMSCLGIITAAYGVPQIMAGVKLLNAVEDIRKYMETGNMDMVSEILQKLYKYFKINGISIIVKISFSILIIIVYIIIIFVFIAKMPGAFKNYGY